MGRGCAALTADMLAIELSFFHSIIFNVVLHVYKIVSEIIIHRSIYFFIQDNDVEVNYDLISIISGILR